MKQRYLFQAFHEAFKSQRESERDYAPLGRKWYRFTLWKMVLAIVLLSTIFAYLRNTHWGFLIGEQIGEAGREFGLISQPNKSKVRVSAVRPFGDLDFEWRVSIPKGHFYEFEVQYSEGKRGNVPCVVPRESLISLSYEKRTSFKSMHLLIQDASGMFLKTFRSSYSFPPRANAIEMPYAQKEISGVLIGDGEQEFSPGESILLYRAEVIDEQGAWGTSYPKGTQIAIWLKSV